MDTLSNREKLKNLRVLTIDAIHPKTKVEYRTQIDRIKNPEQAIAELGEKGFVLIWLDLGKRLAALKAPNGVEVMVFFKRQVSPLSNLSLDLSSGIVLDTENQAWLAINLFELSFTSVYNALQVQIQEKDSEIKKLKGLVTQQRLEVEVLEKETSSVRSKLRDKVYIKQAQEAAIPEPPRRASVSPEIDYFLERIRPIPLQDYVRSCYLNWYFGIGKELPAPSKIKAIKRERILKRMDRMVARARKQRELTEDYKPRLEQPKKIKQIPLKPAPSRPPSKKVKAKPVKKVKVVTRRKVK